MKLTNSKRVTKSLIKFGLLFFVIVMFATSCDRGGGSSRNPNEPDGGFASDNPAGKVFRMFDYDNNERLRFVFSSSNQAVVSLPYEASLSMFPVTNVFTKSCSYVKTGDNKATINFDGIITTNHDRYDRYEIYLTFTSNNGGTYQGVWHHLKEDGTPQNSPSSMNGHFVIQ